MAGDYIGGLVFKTGDGAAPGTGTFTTLPGVTSIGQVGKSNNLTRVTDFDSGLTEEYISGLSDGVEITLECNEDLSDTVQSALIADVDAGANRNIEIDRTDGTDSITLSFQTVAMGYNYVPSFEDANKLNFTLKITGDITRT